MRAMACGPMFEAEATRLSEILLEQGPVSPLLNLGSSTREFRETVKPHIEAQLFKPLREAGITVYHSDIKAAEGVDFVGDVNDPTVAASLRAKGFKSVLVAHVLEHVRDRAALIAACEEMAGPDGLILATVPSCYAYHADPIDTGYRPSPSELAAAFTRCNVLVAEELHGPTFAQAIEAQGSSLWREAARTFLWCLAAPVRPKSARARLDRWRWLKRPYRVSIVLLSVRDANSST